jgi:2-C-methyl-D-erythritol 4-phosphate cytidylyltransferase
MPSEVSLILSLYENRGGEQPTDEAQLAEQQGHRVAMIPGSPLNVKITTRKDMSFARACLEAMPKPKFDAPLHPFADDNLFR